MSGVSKVGSDPGGGGPVGRLAPINHGPSPDTELRAWSGASARWGGAAWTLKLTVDFLMVASDHWWSNSHCWYIRLVGLTTLFFLLRKLNNFGQFCLKDIFQEYFPKIRHFQTYLPSIFLDHFWFV